MVLSRNTVGDFKLDFSFHVVHSFENFMDLSYCILKTGLVNTSLVQITKSVGYNSLLMTISSPKTSYIICWKVSDTTKLNNQTFRDDNRLVGL